MDSSHSTIDIINSNNSNMLQHANLDHHLKLDQQTIRSSNHENDLTHQTGGQRSSSHSGESDVDSGIVALDHNLSRISSGQLPISNDLITQFQTENNCSFDDREAPRRTLSPLNHLDQTNHQQSTHFSHQHNQINHFNHLNDYRTSLLQSPYVDANFKRFDVQPCTELRSKSQSQLYNEPHLEAYSSNALKSYPKQCIDQQLKENHKHHHYQFDRTHHSVASQAYNEHDKSNYFIQHHQTHPNLYLPTRCEIETTVDELDSERLRNSCRQVLARINSTSQQMSNDAIYVNLNTSSPHFATNQLNQNYNYSQPNLQTKSIDQNIVACSVQQKQHNETTPINQYAVPVLINCDCMNCKENKKDQIKNTSELDKNIDNNISATDSNDLNDVFKSKKCSSSSSFRLDIALQKLEDFRQKDLIAQSLPTALTNLERRVNQEHAKRLLLEVLRQKNLEKEILEEKERQLQMHLEERQKMAKERELDNNQMIIANLNQLTLDEKTAITRSNGVQMNAAQYENTAIDNFAHERVNNTNQYQNVPFDPQSTNLNNNHLIELNNNKLNEFTKSCIVQPSAVDVTTTDDDLITKSFNGGYCSQQTRKVLESGTFKKPTDTRTFLQKFHFKFSKAFSRAFFTSENAKTTTIAEKVDTKSLENSIAIERTDENTSQTVAPEMQSNLDSAHEVALERTSNFIEKIKSIDTSRSIKEANNKLKNKSIESSTDSAIDSQVKSKQLSDRKFSLPAKDIKMNTTSKKHRNFEINLDEYCIIRKPDLTPKKYSIDDTKKRGSIKKRNSVSRKNCLNSSKSQQCNSSNLSVSNRRQSAPSTIFRNHNSKSKHNTSSSKNRTHQTLTEENMSAELVEINQKNNTQVIEIKRVPNRHFGFFFARGKVKGINGVYVSRMRDEETKGLLAGLLEIGDQILAIDGVNVQDSSIIEVNYLMTNKNCIRLHVKPYTKS